MPSLGAQHPFSGQNIQHTSQPKKNLNFQIIIWAISNSQEKDMKGDLMRPTQHQGNILNEV